MTFKNARPEVAAVPLLSALQAAPGLAVGLAAGIGAGALHALTGPDHLATLAPLSLDAESAQPRGGWRVAAAWGVQHRHGDSRWPGAEHTGHLRLPVGIGCVHGIARGRALLWLLPGMGCRLGSWSPIWQVLGSQESSLWLTLPACLPAPGAAAC